MLTLKASKSSKELEDICVNSCDATLRQMRMRNIGNDIIPSETQPTAREEGGNEKMAEEMEAQIECA